MQTFPNETEQYLKASLILLVLLSRNANRLNVEGHTQLLVSVMFEVALKPFHRLDNALYTKS